MDALTTRRSLVDGAIEALRARLAAGTWPVGTRIPPEPALMRALGVSRNTVREAVRAMVHAGLLETRQGDGTYVRASVDPTGLLRGIARATLRDHLEVRCLLEVEAARLAARNRSEDDLARLAAALAARGERRRGEPLEDFIERDLAFHHAVVRASGNAALIGLYAYFIDAVRAAIRQTFDDGALPEPDLAAHRAILEAVRAGDAARAGRATRRLLAPLMQALDRLLERGPAGKDAP